MADASGAVGDGEEEELQQPKLTAGDVQAKLEEDSRTTSADDDAAVLAAAAPSAPALASAFSWHADGGDGDSSVFAALLAHARVAEQSLPPPQVAFVGTARTGKSSLVEALAGRQCALVGERYARRADYTLDERVVRAAFTRRPLCVSLVRTTPTTSGGGSSEPRATLRRDPPDSLLPGASTDGDGDVAVSLDDSAELCAALEKRNVGEDEWELDDDLDEMCHPMHVRLAAPDCLPLTLVDAPGCSHKVLLPFATPDPLYDPFAERDPYELYESDGESETAHAAIPSQIAAEAELTVYCFEEGRGNFDELVAFARANDPSLERSAFVCSAWRRWLVRQQGDSKFSVNDYLCAYAERQLPIFFVSLFGATTRARCTSPAAFRDAVLRSERADADLCERMSVDAVYLPMIGFTALQRFVRARVHRAYRASLAQIAAEMAFRSSLAERRAALATKAASALAAPAELRKFFERCARDAAANMHKLLVGDYVPARPHQLIGVSACDEWALLLADATAAGAPSSATSGADAPASTATRLLLAVLSAAARRCNDATTTKSPSAAAENTENDSVVSAAEREAAALLTPHALTLVRALPARVFDDVLDAERGWLLVDPATASSTWRTVDFDPYAGAHGIGEWTSQLFGKRALARLRAQLLALASQFDMPAVTRQDVAVSAAGLKQLHNFAALSQVASDVCYRKLLTHVLPVVVRTLDLHLLVLARLPRAAHAALVHEQRQRELAGGGLPESPLDAFGSLERFPFLLAALADTFHAACVAELRKTVARCAAEFASLRLVAMDTLVDALSEVEGVSRYAISIANAPDRMDKAVQVLQTLSSALFKAERDRILSACTMHAHDMCVAITASLTADATAAPPLVAALLAATDDAALLEHFNSSFSVEQAKRAADAQQKLCSTLADERTKLLAAGEKLFEREKP